MLEPRIEVGKINGPEVGRGGLPTAEINLVARHGADMGFAEQSQAEPLNAGWPDVETEIAKKIFNIEPNGHLLTT